MNLVITVSLLPVCIVLLNSQHRPLVVLYDVGPVNKLIILQRKLRKIQMSFNAWLLKILYQYSWIWIICLCFLGFLSSIVIWIWPGINLSESMEFQMFKEDHPFEQYDLIYKNQFWFERILKVSWLKKILQQNKLYLI